MPNPYDNIAVQNAIANMQNLQNFAQEDAYCSHQRAHHFSGGMNRTTMTQYIREAFHYVLAQVGAQVLPSHRYTSPEEIVAFYTQMRNDIVTEALANARERLPDVIRSLRADDPQTFAALKAAVEAEATAQAERALTEAQSFAPPTCAVCSDPACMVPVQAVEPELV